MRVAAGPGVIKPTVTKGKKPAKAPKTKTKTKAKKKSKKDTDSAKIQYIGESRWF